MTRLADQIQRPADHVKNIATTPCQCRIHPLMNKLNAGFTRVSDEDMDNKAQSIIAALTGNANFATTTPPLATITTSLTAFQDALAMPQGAARTAQVAATRATLTTQLEQLARNLEMTPNVTDAMLATTGFDMRQP